MNYFEGLASVDVGKHIEKKGRFNYLSWAWAVDILGRHHPLASWEVAEYEGKPYMETPAGYFVKVTVTVPVGDEFVSKTQIHPVLDNKNNPIAKPNSFDINTSIQRCLAKAIALHGLGLYIFSGEDLPVVENSPPSDEQKELAIKDLGLAASRGTAVFREEWHKISKPIKTGISAEMLADWKVIAEQADKGEE